MKEHPILFSGPMVKALLAGTKIQTRRVIKPGADIRCPYGCAGDRLWVRETWCRTEDGGIAFRADTWTVHPGVDETWKPSIFMPRWACRLRLEITRVRMEKLQDISEADAIAEGLEPVGVVSARDQYHILWDDLNAKRGFGWAMDPRVWVIEFRKVSA